MDSLEEATEIWHVSGEAPVQSRAHNDVLWTT